jgi:hypothetical protein
VNEGSIRKAAALLMLGGGVRATDWMQYPCPFARWKHASGQDRKPSFGIRINDAGSSHYYCFTCKKSGNLSYLPVDLASHKSAAAKAKAPNLMMEILALEAQSGFGDFDGIAVEEEGEPEPLSETDYGDIFPPAWETEAASDYLRMRGVSREAVELMGVCYDPEDARVVFPVRNHAGALFGYTGRTVLLEADWPKSRHYAKSKDYLGLPKKRTLLNEQTITRATQRLIVVEGPFDCAVAQTYLLRAKMHRWAVVAAMGSGLSKYQLAILSEHSLPVYLFFDADDAGTAGIYGTDGKPGALARLKSDVPVYVPDYPQREGADDVGSLTYREFVAALKGAEAE